MTEPGPGHVVMAPPTVQALFVQVMRSVSSIAKDERNKDQNYNFRGIDAVLNVVGPIVREVGLIALPVAAEVVGDERYETKKGTAMRGVTVRMTWMILGPAGDQMTVQTLGEAADSSDKAVAKAQSVAARVLWLFGLWVPTGEPEVDAVTDERSTRAEQAAADPTAGWPAARVLRGQIGKLGAAMGLTPDDLAARFAQDHVGLFIGDADEPRLRDFLEGLQIEAAARAREAGVVVT